jgi:phosphatidylglycerol:prolipoprotein diacylglycerol transferase
MVREGFSIGPVFIHFYGLLIMFGALAATWMASRLAVRYKQNPEIAWDVLPWALIGGIIGARIWHILTPPASMLEQGIDTMYYLTHPLDALAIWRGGLGIPGAVIGGFLAVYWYTRSHKLSIAVWADMIAPGLALAQAIGRIGNFVNQEVYGAPASVPWAVFIDPQHRLPGFESFEYYHPLFFYEAIWNLLNMGVLLWAGRRFKEWLKPGDIFLAYLVIYPLGRFFLEFLRLDPSPLGTININQTLMAVVLVVSVAMLLYRHRPGQEEVDEEEDEESEGEEMEESDENPSSSQESPFASPDDTQK